MTENSSTPFEPRGSLLQGGADAFGAVPRRLQDDGEVELVAQGERAVGGDALRQGICFGREGGGREDARDEPGAVSGLRVQLVAEQQHGRGEGAAGDAGRQGGARERPQSRAADV